MGIFTKKRDEPNLTPAQGPTSIRPRPEPSPELDLGRELAREREPEHERDPEPAVVVAAQPRHEPSSKAAPSKATPAGPDFGIQNAMELMRKLPPDNVPLVVSVVKTTLESLNIDIESIIQEAKEKRDKIAERISGLESEIADLEEEVGARREEIKALRDDASETKIVQERLQQATTPAGAGRPELGIPHLRPPGG